MIKLVKLNKDAYEYYITNVKGNKDTSYEQAQRKLTRNVQLAYKKKTLINALKLKQEYIYGHLKIVVRFNKIIEIENNTPDTVKGWKADKKEHIKLSKLLGLPHDKYSVKKHSR